MKQGKAINRRRLSQPNPRNSKVGIMTLPQDEKMTKCNYLLWTQKDLIIKESMNGYCQWYKEFYSPLWQEKSQWSNRACKLTGTLHVGGGWEET